VCIVTKELKLGSRGFRCNASAFRVVIFTTKFIMDRGAETIVFELRYILESERDRAYRWSLLITTHGHGRNHWGVGLGGVPDPPNLDGPPNLLRSFLMNRV